MLFPTLNFALFFIAVAVILALIGGLWELKKIFLVAASYVFYACWNWHFCFLLLFSTAVSYSVGLFLPEEDSPRLRKWMVGGGIAVQLLVLAFFKYYDFFATSLNKVTRDIGWGEPVPLIEILLPVAISFFTFHGISYIVDVYRGKVTRCRRFTDMMLYMSFFPQLVAGPIVRSSKFLPQLERPSSDPPAMAAALLMIAGGLFKKVILASYLGTQLVDPVFADPASFSTLDLVFALYGFAVQIFCDFSGYTDIAIGLAALLGFAFPQNFNQPYRSASLRDFWRRWHMTLSFWLRDYLYIPLGGSHRGSVRTSANLLITMLLGGLWHGAAMKFVMWGALHGGGLVLERPFSERLENTRGLFRVMAVLLTFHFVCLTWLFFHAEDMESVWLYLQSITPLKPGSFTQVTPFTLGLIAIGIGLHFVSRNMPERIAAFPVVQRAPDWALALAFGICVLMIDAAGPSGVAPFIYFQF